MAPGYSEREALLKRFLIRDRDALYVYTSSVPDMLHSSDEFGRDDVSRYTLVFEVIRFWV